MNCIPTSPSIGVKLLSRFYCSRQQFLIRTSFSL
ncbi:hypothetical protein T01_484 [Trichinella spiralis]|uniref:Uncharacterized protein n=1 Tax=Trichinella spiralis TaxID=6334 RepID=A0A0V0YQC3_TRISP|nr:hypothetical protein T01_8014 [Trichinella spiralis]KRY02521.1 hypothetical protein T01_484 [Trichinella spiralis]